VNPNALCTDPEIESWHREFGVLVSPLVSEGYRCTGRWPCTRPTREGENARAGRWRGLQKTECGLHD